MSRSRASHKRERARRHARQIAEGKRMPRGAKTGSRRRRLVYCERVRLSEVDPGLVRAVIEEVGKIDRTVLGR